MILDILKLQNPSHVATLRAKSDNAEFSRETADLTQNMVETMFASNGVGLAAPQVGVNRNIFVMRTMAGIEHNNREHRVIINPHTVIEVGESHLETEGCLSIPGLWGDVQRFKEIGCVYWDVEGNRHGLALAGFEARIYQHEYDHLEGTLFIDRAARLRKATTAIKIRA